MDIGSMKIGIQWAGGVPQNRCSELPIIFENDTEKGFGEGPFHVVDGALRPKVVP